MNQGIRQRWKLPGVVLLGGLLLAVLGGGAQAQGTIRVALPAEGDTLDPTHMSLTTSFSIATNIYSGLVRYAPGTIELMPDLAESWEASDDGLTWTFHLRSDVSWHKGYGELTAQDVVDSFEHMRNPDSSSRWVSELSIVDDISAPDAQTVVFTLHRPSAAFLHTVSAFRQGLIVNMQALADFGDEYGRNPVGTGAYEFVSWTPGVEVELRANPDHHLGAPEVETATFVVIPDENVRMLALQRGEVDIAMGLQNPEIYAQLLSVDGIESGEVTSSTVHGIGFNTRMAPFDDVRVRTALLHAIDRELIAETIWGGLAEAAYSDLAPPYLGHNPDVPRYEYDPELAKELLAEAGYPDGFRTTLYWLSTHSTELLGAVRAMWNSIGVSTELKMVDGGAWIAAMGTGEAPMILRLTTRADPHQWYSTNFHSAAFPPGMNSMYYDAVDELIDRGAMEADLEARASIYEEIQEHTMRDLPYLPLYWPKHAHPYWNYVEGWGGRQQYDAWLQPVRLNR